MSVEAKQIEVFGLLDMRGLVRALRLVVVPLVWIGLISAVLLALVQIPYLRDEGRTRRANVLAYDYEILLAQLRRSESIDAPHILLMGDSSCLMGIYVPALPTRFGKPTQSLCNLGYTGPRGYAYMLDKVAERGKQPDALVLAFHPITFHRVPSWEFATNLVLSDGKIDLPPLRWPKSALEYIQIELFERVVYTPLPGRYGVYFGGNNQIIGDLVAARGSTVDPGTGLNYRSLDEVARVARTEFGRRKAIDFKPNEAFLKALKPLAKSLDRFDRSRTFLMITPVPDIEIDVQARAERARAAALFASRLGIPEGNVLDTPGAMPLVYFSGSTHLNRWGRRLFTGDLANLLSERVPPAAGRSAGKAGPHRFVPALEGLVPGVTRWTRGEGVRAR